MIDACRGSTGFICPLPELCVGLWPAGISAPSTQWGRGPYTDYVGERWHRSHVDARADRRRDDRGKNPAELVRLEGST